MADTRNRSIPRKAFAALLSTALAGQVAAVYDHNPGDFETSPAVMVVSSGGEREQAGQGTQQLHNDFNYEVWVFVRDHDDASGWTPANAEDRLDLIEKIIADTIAENRSGENWDYIDHRGSSTVNPATVGGRSYNMEIIPIGVSFND